VRPNWPIGGGQLYLGESVDFEIQQSDFSLWVTGVHHRPSFRRSEVQPLAQGPLGRHLSTVKATN